MSRKEKGWFDLDTQGFKEAISNLKQLKDVDEYMLRRRINAFEEGELISPEEATGLREHLDSLTKT